MDHLEILPIKFNLFPDLTKVQSNKSDNAAINGWLNTFNKELIDRGGQGDNRKHG